MAVRPAVWRCRGVDLPVGERVHVMGILNVTPDSFSDGGQFSDTARAVARGLAMVEEGADILDVGGESTRPGAAPVSEEEEVGRVVPVIRELAAQVEVPISVDTTKAGVARAALKAGAVIVNDVSALRHDPEMGVVAAGEGAGVVLMHMLGEPRTMQDHPRYGDVVSEVRDSLDAWATAAEARGIAYEAIAVDPGIGFGKTRDHNLALLRHLPALGALGYPVLVGPSRKSFIGATLGLPVDQRLEATTGAVAWSVGSGASIVRVHDVCQMVRVVRMVEAIRGEVVAPPLGADRVVVRGLRVFGHHGVHPEERQQGQEFVVDVDAHLDLAPAGAEDNLAKTLDYSALVRQLSAVVAGEPFFLIEALAERLAAEVLAHDRVLRVIVRVGKPQAMASRGVDDVYVEIDRHREPHP